MPPTVRGMSIIPYTCGFIYLF